MATVTQTQSTAETTQQASSLTRLGRWLPLALGVIAVALILISTAFPYWRMTLLAPQYPGGLEMRVFVNYMTGDDDPQLDEVQEIDGLNHYIGMKSLYEAAQLERAIAIPAVLFMCVLVIIAAIWKARWAWLLAVPAIGFPFVYLADLGFWLAYYGQNLDPSAPLSSAIKPFTPPLLGEGVVGQFRTIAEVSTGWYLAVGAGVVVLVMIILKIWTQRETNT